MLEMVAPYFELTVIRSSFSQKQPRIVIVLAKKKEKKQELLITVQGYTMSQYGAKQQLRKV
jgi:hypothetical protein